MSVYITFEDSLSVERALASNSRDKDAARVEILKSQCFGDKPFLPVTEPSEVIWENYYLGMFKRVKRVVLTYFCAFCLMSYLFYGILGYELGKSALRKDNIEPVNCDTIY